MSRRRLILFVLAVLAAAAGSGTVGIAPARAAEDLAVPFTCRVERNGRLVLTRAPDQLMPIVGARRQRSYTFCHDDDSRRCRLRMMHRFDVMCGGERVPFIALAAAATQMSGHAAFVRQRHYHIPDVGRAPRYVEDCFEAQPAFSGGRSTPGGSFARPCWPRRQLAAMPGVLVLPAEFAPLDSVGGRIVERAAVPVPAQPTQPVGPSSAAKPAPGSLPAPTPNVVGASQPAAAVPAQTSAPSAPAEIAAVAKAPVVHVERAVEASGGASGRSVEVAAVRTTPVPVATLGAWSTVTLAAEADEPAGAGEGAIGAADLASLVAGLALLAALVGGLAYWFWSRRPISGSGALARFSLGGLALRRDGAVLDPADRKAIEELGQTAAKLLQSALQTVASLEQAAPLRGVLRQEIDLIRGRLAEAASSAEATAAGKAPPEGRAPVSPRQLRQRLQSAIRELHRVVKIAEGAAASFSAIGGPRALPRTREEAFDLLGVNADVSDSVLKKVVDALRMSWHPDHARDEPDRVRREERTKQINVAWDLITRRRAEA